MKFREFCSDLYKSLLKYSFPAVIYYFIGLAYKFISKWILDIFFDITQGIGKILWLGSTYLLFTFFGIAFIGVIKEDIEKRNQKREIERLNNEWEKREEERLQALPEQRIKRVLEKDPITSEELLKKNAESYYRDYTEEFQSSSLQVELSNSEWIIPEKKLDNQDTYLHLEKELEALSSYNGYANRMMEALQQAQRNYPMEDSISNIPTKYIQEVLRNIGITPSVLQTTLNHVHLLQNLINEANTYAQKEISIIASGLGGENRMNEELSLYEYVWNHYANVRFEVNGQSVETDNLIVSTRGIFSIEVKNYAQNGTYSLHLTKDGQWLKVFPNGKDEPLEKSITSQINRHIALKQKLIYDEMRKIQGDTASFIPLQPIVVIANDTVRIQNDSDLPVLRISQVYHHIMKQPEILTAEQVEQISKIIEDNRLPVKTYPVKSYLPILDSLYKELSDKEQRILKAINMTQRYLTGATSDLLSLEEKQNKK